MEDSYDVVREILVRVKDVTTLFRCATVCKGWRSLFVADDAFLRRCFPEDSWRSSPFRSFFTQRRLYIGYPPRVPYFVPAARQLLGNGCRYLSSFVSCAPAGYFHNAVPLVSRHGLLLVRLEPHLSANVVQDRSGVLLAVCDLLAGTVHELPRLEHYWDFEQGRKVSGYSLLTATDWSSSNYDKDDIQQQSSRHFKVLILTIQHWQTRYDLHMFSSAEDSRWNKCSGFVEDEDGRPIWAMLRQHNAIVVGGAAHWLMWGNTGTYTLHVSAETGQVSSTRMLGARNDDSRSEDYDKPYFTIDGEGNLTLLSLRRDGRILEISTSHDLGRSFHTSMLVLKQPDQRTNETNHVYTCLGEVCGMMLVMVNHKRVYMADVKTGVMREVPKWPCCNGLIRRRTVPFEIDWPSFFASRLGVGTY